MNYYVVVKHMPDLDSNLDYEVNKMEAELAYMSICNIKWSCLFSGAGIFHLADEKNISKMFGKVDKNQETSDLISNIVLMKCLYKKAKPVFTKPSDEIINPGKYMWDINRCDKTIISSVQSLCIVCLLRAAELLESSDPNFGCIIVKFALIIYDFITTYLRNEEGLFVDAENKTKYLTDELKIKPVQKEAKLSDQILMLEAFLYLYKLTSRRDSLFYYSSSTKYLNEADNIYEYLIKSRHLLYDFSTKELCFSISSISRCCSIDTNIKHKEEYEYLIIELADELSSRIKMNGEIMCSSNNLNSSPIPVDFCAVSAFLEAFNITEIIKFKESAIKIYNFLYELYDTDYNLFYQGDDSKVSYSIKDIADIIKTVYLYNKVQNNEKTSRMLLNFYNSSLLNSGILQSIPQKNIQFMNHELIFPDNIPITDEINKAPVFLKSIRLSFKKNPSISISKHYSSYYSLYASYTFLYYLFNV